MMKAEVNDEVQKANHIRRNQTSRRIPKELDLQPCRRGNVLPVGSPWRKSGGMRGSKSMVNKGSAAFSNDRFPLEAYNEMRRWLGVWANQEFDLDKRLAAFIALETLNSLGETMLGERMPKNLQ